MRSSSPTWTWSASRPVHSPPVAVEHLVTASARCRAPVHCHPRCSAARWILSVNVPEQRDYLAMTAMRSRIQKTGCREVQQGVHGGDMPMWALRPGPPACPDQRGVPNKVTPEKSTEGPRRVVGWATGTTRMRPACNCTDPARTTIAASSRCPLGRRLPTACSSADVRLVPQHSQLCRQNRRSAARAARNSHARPISGISCRGL